MFSTSHLYIFGVVLLCGAATSFEYSVRDAACDDGKERYWRYPYDCKKYYGCENKMTKLFTCGTNLFWNDAVKACDLLERVKCDIQPPDCSDGKNTYYRYPYDCHLFWECLNYTLLVLPCPTNTNWDDIEKQCDDHADCSDIIPYPSSSTEAPTTAPPTTINPSTPEMDCSKAMYFPCPFNCYKYYECDHGVAKLMTCDKGTVWNPLLNTCDHPENVDCGARPTTPSP